MKICLLIDGAEEYGIRRVTEDLLAEWHEHDLVVLALTSGPFTDRVRELGFTALSLDLGRPLPFPKAGRLRKAVIFARHAVYNHAASRRVKDALSTIRPDLVLLQYTRHASMFTGREPYRRACLIHEVLGSNYPFEANLRIMRRSFRRSGTVAIANSAATAKSLEARNFKVGFVYLGCDLRRFSDHVVPAIDRKDLMLPPDATVFAIFARLTAEKGQHLFVEALATNPDAKRCHLLLFGGLTLDQTSSAYPERLRQVASSMGWGKHLHILGPVDHPERYYGLADVVVSSSTVAESFGLSIIEAMAMQKPVLAHGFGGARETVTDGKTGWLTDDATVDTFRQAVSRALAARDQWPAMGRAARTRVEQMFDRKLAARRILDLACAQS